MTDRPEVYRCTECGNIVEMLHEGAGTLVCCDQPMIRLEEKTEDSATEKHVPYIERADGQVTVRVGQNAAHPMEKKHYIEWIELIADGTVYRRFLKPDDEPKAVFCVDGESISAREYCNVHGLWKGS